MDPELTSANEDTETSTSTQGKTFTQDEVNALLAKTKTQLANKFAKKYEDLGDPEELRGIVDSYRKGQQEQQLKRGEFDKVLQDLAAKKDAEIQKRDAIIQEFKLNTPIVEAAAKLRSVNPEQVKSLVRSNVRLNAEGEVEVIDAKGQVRYDDSGKALTVETYVQEFLQQNPHFVQPTPSTTTSRSSIGVAGGLGKIDVNTLDMKNPEHRKLYAEARKSQK